MSEIRLERMSFYASHGCFSQERVIGTWFECDVTMQVDTTVAQGSDDINDTVNYLEAYQCVKREFENPSNLLEHLAGRIGKELMKQFTSIESIKVKVSKLNPPLGGQLEAVSVSVDMQRNESIPPTK